MIECLVSQYPLEIRADTNAATFDPFRDHPNIPLTELPNDLPPEYRRQLQSLLPHLSSDDRIVNLSACHRDASGALICDGAVVNRPWEWMEHLGEPILDSKDDDQSKLVKPVIKNSGSIALETFAARMTGDRIARGPSTGEEARLLANMRLFEDSTTEDVFSRDWRETRVDLEVDSFAGTEADGESDQQHIGSHMKVEKHSPRASPASTAGSSRPSHRGSNKSMKASPGGMNRHSASTVDEAMDVDAAPSGSSSKRNQPSKRKPSSDNEGEHGSGKKQKMAATKVDKAKAKRR